MFRNNITKSLILIMAITACRSSEPEKKTEYFEDGTIKFEYFLKDGKKEGEFRRYTTTGILSSLYLFKNGMQHGRTVHYYRDGKIQEVQYFKEGKKHLSDTMYYESGKIQMITDFVDDKKHGYLRKFGENDSLIFEAKYDADILVEVNGKKLDSK